MTQSSARRNVLIIEDDRNKSRALRECLVSAGIPDSSIRLTETIVVAAQLIDIEDFSGILLDLAFHASQESSQLASKRYLAGVNILRQLEEMRKSVPVIVATQHKSFESAEFPEIESVGDLRQQLSEAFEENFKGLVEVELGSNTWREELVALVRRWFL
jgi:CheY-like chemotaxis protein